MIERLPLHPRGLPVNCRVALRAVRSESALMRVIVASHTTCRKPQPGMVQILACEQSARLRGNMLRGVTRATIHAYMFAIEKVASLRVVESFGCRIPAHHLEVRAVVIGVAFHTSCTRSARSWISRMQSSVLLQFCCDFPMAFNAPESWSLRRNHMTLDAV